MKLLPKLFPLIVFGRNKMRKISVRIAHQHTTSISLENEFYEALKKIAQEQDKPLSTLITEIDAERTEMNLSSAIRVYILKHVMKA